MKRHDGLSFHVGYRLVTVLGLSLALAGCGGASDGSSSEVAVSTVSGALNNSGGSTVGWNELSTHEKKSGLAWLLDAVGLEHPAFAATWTCTGGSLTPSYAGPAKNPYAFTPTSCTVKWGNGRSASSSWSGAFTIDFGASCDATHESIDHQAADCTITRTSATGGDVRTVTGPDGGLYAVTHDTNGAGTGWDATVLPAPSNGGVILGCGANGCSASRSLTISGSHLTSNVTPPGGTEAVAWNHTVSTGATPLTITGTDTARVVTGSVTVQHNLARFTSTTTFDNVGFGDANCCFPTTGSVVTTFEGGRDKSKTETLTFSPICGETILTDSAGRSSAYTLQHCL